MKRILLYIAFLFCAYTNLSAQSYMNEWIDFNKTYYKFKVGATGLYRISQAQLAAMGIATADAAHFQLWRHGQQVPIFTSSQSGALPANGFIEFYGEVNDGKWEKRMYLEPSYQINDRWSLFTDTAAYFLTVNTNAAENKRFVTTTNDLSSGLSAEPYFMHTAATYFRNIINPGFAADLGSYVYSSAFDRGEGFSSSEFNALNSLTTSFTNLYIASSAGMNAKLKFSAVGRTVHTRSIQAYVNGNLVADRSMNFFNFIVDESADNIPLSVLNSNSTSISFKISTTDSNPQFNRSVVGMAELRYPRLFNFGGLSNFEFELSESTSGNNLIIDNFNFGGEAPVLYDLTNGLRIIASIISSTQIRIVLPPSLTKRKLVLLSQDVNAVKSVNNFITRNFVNYALSSNQADYIIISNPILYSDANGVNQVEQYRLYRSSITGGGFNAKVYNVQDILDQFGYGIKNNAYAIKNFLRFAYSGFNLKPQYCFIIGKGVVYNSVRSAEASATIERLNLVPTLGNPASDIMMASDEMNIVPQIPIGRLTVINGNEVKAYLDKVKQYEAFYNSSSCNVSDELWKKNVIHVAGANDRLGEQIRFFLNQYGTVLKDTLFGANIYSLQKTGIAAVQTIASENISRLFTEGFSLLTYFGHSAPSTLEYNLSDPKSYPSIGKYPIMLVNGCQAGNMFLPDASRLTGNYIITENWILTPQRGAVAFIASTHLGVAEYLHIYTEEFYNQLAMDNEGYGKSLGRIMANTIDTLIKRNSFNDFYVRMHTEEITLHGDPAIKLYSYSKPDFAIEDAMVKISPSFVSIADSVFSASVKIVNIGRAVSDSVHIKISRFSPDGSVDVPFNRKIKRIGYADSILLEMPIDPLKHKGTNKLRVEIDPDNQLDEGCENNNSVIKEFFIYEDEVRPIYPYNYSIVNTPNPVFYASSANATADIKSYYFEIDTTKNFNSMLKKTDSVSSKGGVFSFKPTGVNYQDNIVYYWRVGMKQDNISVQWNGSSFVYSSGNESGYNQSHFFQFAENKNNNINLDTTTRKHQFDSVLTKIQIRSGISPFHPITASDLSINYDVLSRQGCNLGAFKFYVLDPKTLKPMENWMQESWAARFYSHPINCLGNTLVNYFEYSYYFPVYRNWAMNFMDSIPNGSYVIISNYGTNNYSLVDASVLKSDEVINGAGKSIYHKLLGLGCTMIDSFKSNRPFIFVYKKGDPSFTPIQIFSSNSSDLLVEVLELYQHHTAGTIETPWLGPAKSWNTLKWDAISTETPSNDSTAIDIIGKTLSGSEILLSTIHESRDTGLSFINASTFPFLKLRMNSFDRKTVTPKQLVNWKLIGEHVPEGAVAPNLKLNVKDTVEIGEPLEIALAFQNVSKSSFDSLKVKMVITDVNNVPHTFDLPKARPLPAGDSLVFSYKLDSRQYAGSNTLYIMFNPDNDQLENHLFNNFIFKNFYVKPDSYKPWLDVTFDGTHILNYDIVSSKPHILVKLKDDSRYLALSDTTGLKIKIQYPSVNGAAGPLVEYKPQSDSVRFTPADLSKGENSATIDLYPKFMQDGEYELYVSGNDQSGNKAGNLEYKVAFQVVNKPMISNMLNYPNPFTSSTAFVFTITGYEVPQNIRIQILTITGKVVREITKSELGPLRIGRNITEYKWDGTDQFGNKLANGVYLYRVITNSNGKSLDKFRSESDNTDQYFNKGYGKMYLMR